MSHPSNSSQSMMACGTGTWRARRNPNRTGSGFAALPVTLTLALALMAALVWMVGLSTSREVQAMPAAPLPLEEHALDADVIRVATTGEDSEGCGTVITPCRTVQYAVDEAHTGDEIRVAAGTYTGTNSYGGLSQVIYLTKSLMIRGGYTTSDWTTPDPETNPTTLDAEGAGRVMVISPTTTVHLEGLRFQGGDATGLGGGPDERDAGGGLYILTGTVTISDSLIFSNTASVTGTVPGTVPPLGGGFGGGLYSRGGHIELTRTEIVSNIAGVNLSSFGGGVYLDHGSAVILRSWVMNNTASYRDFGQGGGLYLDGSNVPEVTSAYMYLDGRAAPGLFSARLIDNVLQGNYASRQSDGQGGGMYAYHYDLELLDNLIQHNAGGGPGLDSRGGGLYVYWSDAWLQGNQVLYNVASAGKKGLSGGVHFCTCSSTTVILENNIILGNIANTYGNGYGGGVSFCNSLATLDSNAIISNTATLSTTAEGWGGGVWAGDMVSISMRNDVVAGNHARTRGSGLSFGDEEEEHNALGSRLYHVTIADNSGGIGEGIHVINSAVFLTNTIIASHTVGIYVARLGPVDTMGEATLKTTLWYNNQDNTGGGGDIEIGGYNYEGNPAFVDPENWDYHIEEGSAALDRGVATGVRTDMDAQPRPWLEPDLGADEYWPGNISIRAYLPLILRQ